LEKAIGGHQSSAQSDAGTVLAMVGGLCTWLNDHKSPILTIATVNDYSKLPGELTRAGRFDERFFAGLPARAARVNIAAIHLRRYSIKKAAFNAAIQTIADLTERWTPSEIALLVLSAARRTKEAFPDGCFAEAARYIKPLSVTRQSEVEELIKWGTTNLRPADAPEEVPNPKIRRIRAR
jgi:SpoVK/Ycf46/Vps4 family AAA+-type ATPase